MNIDDEKQYSDNWKNLDSLLVYQLPNFQFKSHVIIVELDDCLIRKTTSAKLYDPLNRHEFSLFENDFIKRLIKEIGRAHV